MLLHWKKVVQRLSWCWLSVPISNVFEGGAAARLIWKRFFFIRITVIGERKKPEVCFFLGRLRQGRNEVRWRPGQEASLAPPYSNLRPFGSKWTVWEESTCDIVWTFRRPRSPSAPGGLCPRCAPGLKWTAERSFLRSAAVIHSVTVNRTHNLETRTLFR